MPANFIGTKLISCLHAVIIVNFGRAEMVGYTFPVLGFSGASGDVVYSNHLNSQWI